MKYVGLAVRLGAAVLLVATGMAQARKTAFSLTAVAAYSEVKTGEDVYVKVTFLNNLNRVVTLEFASPLCDYSMEVRNSADNLVPDTEAKSESDCAHRHSTGADVIFQLKPHAFVTNTISVSMFSDMSRLGEYSVRAAWREPKELGGVLVKSNTVKITVVP
jgi:hypothetical protein